MDQVEKKIAQARVALIFDHPFFGYLALVLNPVEKNDMPMPTMGTDGVNLYYNRDFVINTPLKQLMGVITHEICHIILWHLPRRQGRDFERFNQAADYAANALIHEEIDSIGKLELPDDHLYKKEWENKIAEWIYNQIPPGECGGGIGTMDSHDSWGNWKSENGDGDSKDGSSGNQPQDGDGKIDGLSGQSAMEQEWRNRVAQASNQARMQGKLADHIKRIIDDVLQPQLDWASILRDMITSCAKSDYRLNHPNKKHLWRGFILPGITGEEIRIAVAVDTSGSISEQEIAEFMAEIHGICQTYSDYTIYAISCDAAVHQREELHPFDEIPLLSVGGGGTDFRPVFKECDDLFVQGKDFTTLVYFTDLYGTFPDRAPEYSVIWLSVSDQTPPFGRLIQYPRVEATAKKKRR